MRPVLTTMPHLASIPTDYIQFCLSRCGHPYTLESLQFLRERLYGIEEPQSENGT